MSQGARFASLFGHAFRAAAYPVAAVAMSMGEVARPVLDAGGVRVPTVFVVAENDAPGTNAAIRAEQAAAAAAGVPTALHEARETRLAPDRFRRIPEIDDRTARLLFDTFVAAGIWNAAGERLVPVAEAVARAEAVLLPAPVGGLRADILDQVRAVLAVHQYTGAFSREVGDFADLHLPAPSCADALLARDEQCDDGNLRDGDCCGAGCQVEAAGTVCRPAAGPCDIAEACDGEAPACPGDGRHPDTDLDGVCDPADVCTNAAGQRDFVVVGRLPKPRLVARRVNTDPRAGNETLSLAGVFRLPDGAGFPALDPAASGARVRVESAAARVLLDVVLPGGARQGRGRGWTRAHTGRRWTWVDPGGTVPGGVRRLRITDRGRTRPGHVAVEMVARRSTLSVVAGDEPLAVAVALGDRASGSTGLCGESRFGAGECRFGRNGRTLRCRR
jgi:cysteine-rich repeat protein